MAKWRGKPFSPTSKHKLAVLLNDYLAKQTKRNLKGFRNTKKRSLFFFYNAVSGDYLIILVMQVDVVSWLVIRSFVTVGCQDYALRL